MLKYGTPKPRSIVVSGPGGSGLMLYMALD